MNLEHVHLIDPESKSHPVKAGHVVENAGGRKEKDFP